MTWLKNNWIALAIGLAVGVYFGPAIMAKLKPSA